MKLRKFIIGLAISFGVAWLAVVVVPFYKMRSRAPLMLDEAAGLEGGIFYPKRAGRLQEGARVYAANGCYTCHSQLIRPSYAGNDLAHPNMAGIADDPDRGDTRRETNAYDYAGESFAQIGVMRYGQDLSNLGRRVTMLYAKDQSPSAWLYAFLYNPKDDSSRIRTGCPPHHYLFKQRKITGERSADALAIASDPGTEIVPTSEGRALVSYLLSLKKDQEVPPALDFAPKAAAGDL